MSNFSLKPRIAASLIAIAAAGVLAGCANRDSITVGAIPDDYRTNHPIVIAEKEQILDLPVAASDRGMTGQQRTALKGFLAYYDRSAGAVVTVVTPSGSLNEVAASIAARDFAHYAVANGVPQNRIMSASYQAESAEVSAPVRITYSAMQAQTDKCGRWPADILSNGHENKHYADFGCSYQNNLAAQVANPSDLLGPRKQSTIDAERRGLIIDGYRKVPFFSPAPSREVDY